MAREFFPAYHSYLKSIEPLTNAECGRLFRACLEYSMTGAVPELRGNERFIFPMIRQQIDRDREKYNSKFEKNRQNVMRRYTAVNDGVSLSAKATKEKEKTKTKAQEKESEKKKAFSPPSLSEVEAYCRERDSTVDPKRFFDYFTAGGWKDSKGNQVKSWKQKLIAWEAFAVPPSRPREENAEDPPSYDLEKYEKYSIFDDWSETP